MSKRILIVEDNPLISDDLAIIISNLGYQVVGQADSVTEAIKIIQSTTIDLALLDIQLKGDQDGIDLAHVIKEQFQFPFIFSTSYFDDETIYRIRNTNPAGYIVKPFKDADLKANISLAFSRQQHDRKKEEVEPNHELSLFVRNNNEIVKIDYHTIEWVKGENNYSDIYYQNGKKSTVAQTLKSIEEKLSNYGFIRIHKSYVIHLSKISTINGNNVFIGTQMLPIGKAYRKQFFERLTIV